MNLLPIRFSRSELTPPPQLVFACPGCVGDIEAEQGVHITDAGFQTPIVAGLHRNDDLDSVPYIQGTCEFGHSFRIEFWAHKGAVMVEVHDTSRTR